MLVRCVLTIALFSEFASGQNLHSRLKTYFDSQCKNQQFMGSVAIVNGELSGVQVLEGSDAVVEAKLKGGILRITEEDGVQFDMKITGTDQAQLLVVMPSVATQNRPMMVTSKPANEN